MLLSDRRRRFGMRDQNEEPDALQGALFAPDSLAPARPARPPGPTPDPFAPHDQSREPEPADSVAPSAPMEEIAAPDDAIAREDASAPFGPAGEVIAPDDAPAASDPIAGPTDPI